MERMRSASQMSPMFAFHRPTPTAQFSLNDFFGALFAGPGAAGAIIDDAAGARSDDDARPVALETGDDAFDGDDASSDDVVAGSALCTVAITERGVLPSGATVTRVRLALMPCEEASSHGGDAAGADAAEGGAAVATEAVPLQAAAEGDAGAGRAAPSTRDSHRHHRGGDDVVGKKDDDSDNDDDDHHHRNEKQRKERGASRDGSGKQERRVQMHALAASLAGLLFALSLVTCIVCVVRRQRRAALAGGAAPSAAASVAQTAYPGNAWKLAAPAPSQALPAWHPYAARRDVYAAKLGPMAAQNGFTFNV